MAVLADDHFPDILGPPSSTQFKALSDDDIDEPDRDQQASSSGVHSEPAGRPLLSFEPPRSEDQPGGSSAVPFGPDPEDEFSDDSIDWEQCMLAVESSIKSGQQDKSRGQEQQPSLVPSTQSRSPTSPSVSSALHENPRPQPRQCACQCKCGAADYNLAMGFEPTVLASSVVKPRSISRAPERVSPHKSEQLNTATKPSSPATTSDWRPSPVERHASHLEKRNHCPLVPNSSTAAPSPSTDSAYVSTDLDLPPNSNRDPVCSSFKSTNGPPTPDSHKPLSHPDARTHRTENGMNQPLASVPVTSMEEKTLATEVRRGMKPEKSEPIYDAPIASPSHEGLTVTERAQVTAVTSPSGQHEGNPPLSMQQKAVLDMVVEGRRSLMFTGGAGTGKSVLVRALVKELRRRYHFPDAVAVCAMTGIAALHIGGQTIHSWAGIGLGNRPVLPPSGKRQGPRNKSESLLDTVTRSKPARKRWMSVQVLLVDEVSMLDAVLFDKLEQLSRLVRNCDEPFGGIQLVLVGDFYQLPPVIAPPTFFGPQDQQARLKLEYQQLCKTYLSRFVFDAKTWAQCIPRVVILRQVFRQADSEFVRMLEEARHGELKPKTVRKFYELSRPLDVSDGIEPTELFATRNQVGDANMSRLRALPGPSTKYQAQDESYVHDRNFSSRFDSGSVEDQIAVFLDKHVMAPRQIELKVGAQVMLIKNLSNGLVNGSRGIVVGFCDVHGLQLAHDQEGRGFLVDPQQAIQESTSALSTSPRHSVTGMDIEMFDQSTDSSDSDSRQEEFFPGQEAPRRLGRKLQRSLEQLSRYEALKFGRDSSPDAVSAAGPAWSSVSAPTVGKPIPLSVPPIKPENDRDYGVKKEKIEEVDTGDPDGRISIQERDDFLNAAPQSPSKHSPHKYEPSGQRSERAPESVPEQAHEARNAYEPVLEKDIGFEVAVAASSSRAEGRARIDAAAQALKYAREGVAYPVVRFASGQQLLFPPLSFDVQSPVGFLEAQRIQVRIQLLCKVSSWG